MLVLEETSNYKNCIRLQFSLYYVGLPHLHEFTIDALHPDNPHTLQ